RLNETMVPFNKNALTRSTLDEFLSVSHETIELLTVNLQRAKELVKNFKQMSLDQASQSHHSFPLKIYLEETLFSLKPTLKNKKIKVQIHCPDDLVVDSYPGVLFHVMIILVMNTVSHAYLPGQEGTITIEVSSSNDEVTLIYSDNGKGIP